MSTKVVRGGTAPAPKLEKPAAPAAPATVSKPAPLAQPTGFGAAVKAAPGDVPSLPAPAAHVAKEGLFQTRPQEERFFGKHGYPDFQKGVRRMLTEMGQLYYGQKKWPALGHQTPFGTLIEKGKALEGSRISGIGIKLVGTIAEPMVEATLTPFDGVVQSVKDTQTKGPDPIWVASIRTDDGKTLEVNLTNARGLRFDPETAKGKTLTGDEQQAMAARRKQAFEDFGKQYGVDDPKSPPWAHSDNVRGRLAKLPPELRAKVEAYREKLRAMVEGKAEGTEYLARNPADMVPRPLHEVSDEKFRPLVEEAQRMLYDTTGPHGANRWVVDLATEVVLDLHDKGQLEWGTRNIHLMNPHFNYPFLEGRDDQGNVAIPTKNIDVHDLPLIPRQAVLDLVDRRIREYGFDKKIDEVKHNLEKQNVPGLTVELTPGAQRLAALFATDLKLSTPSFIEMTKNGVLFTDPYFQVKPHGQFSHIFQWLYLADRLSHSERNNFGRNMHDVVLNELPQQLMMETGPSTIVTDHVGQRAPQNPDHWNNLLKLVFRTDEDLKTEGAAPGVPARAAKSLATT